MEYIKPDQIETRSFDIIRAELPHPIDEALAPVILRVIHTTADFEYLDTLEFSESGMFLVVLYFSRESYAR